VASTKTTREGRKPHARIGSWQEEFLDNLRDHGCVDAAARDAGVSTRAVYKHRIRDEDFALEFTEAIDYATSSLEQECHRRAMAGSDLLLIFRLKKLDHSYRDNWNPSKGALDDSQMQLLADIMQEAAYESGMDVEQNRRFRETLVRRLKAVEST
jgi:hypothetical protein